MIRAFLLPLVLTLVPATGLPARAAQNDFGWICRELVQKTPSIGDYSTRFTAGFRKAVPLKELVSIFSALSKESGDCASFTIEAKELPNRYRILACLSMGLNNRAHPLPGERFMDLVKKTIKWAETKIP